MRLQRFRCNALNGYLDFDLDLSRETTFLVGINGSGKTSVLKAIMALVGPDLAWIQTASFRSLELQFESEGRHCKIGCSRDPDGTLVQLKIGDQKPDRFLITPAIYASLSRQRDEYTYDEDGDLFVIRDENIDIPEQFSVLNSIKQFPTPIFLGLDRTSLPSTGDGGARSRRARPSRRVHPTIRAFLDDSVIQAEALATSAGRAARFRRARRAEQLRESILLTLFSQLGDQATSVPRQADLRRLRNTHRSLKSAFSILGISPSKTDMVIDPFFDGLIKTGTSISRFKNLGVALQSAREDSFEWINRAPQLSLIRQVERLVNEFNDSERKIFEKIRRYEEIVNSFLNDSKKSISFREDGELLVSLPSTVRSDVLMLSSGERQLFVLITALMFNEDEKQANVLIIDEPELSLHIKWQEMFVSAIRTANPETQVILATHSPSIINDLEEDCVDLA